MDGTRTLHGLAQVGAPEPDDATARRPVVWVVFDPVYQEYMASLPGRCWCAVRDRAHAAEFGSEAGAERIRRQHWSHRASAFVGRAPAHYTVGNETEATGAEE